MSIPEAIKKEHQAAFDSLREFVALHHKHEQEKQEGSSTSSLPFASPKSPAIEDTFKSIVIETDDARYIAMNNYINAGLVHGRLMQDIKKDLIKAGWRIHDILTVLELRDKKKE